MRIEDKVNLWATRTVTAILIAATLYWAFGCASLKAASEHGAQIGIGAGIGIGVGMLAGGIVLLPIMAGAAASAVATILAEPPCPGPTGAVSTPWSEYLVLGIAIWLVVNFMFGGSHRLHIFGIIKRFMESRK